MDTPASLLERLRKPAPQKAWDRFVQMYTPVLYAWARHLCLQPHDAADLVQEIFAVLVKQLPDFQYDAGRSFRAWLKTVLLNKWRESRRKQTPVALADQNEVLDPHAEDPVAELEDAEYRRHLVARALQLMQADFQPATWQACWEFVVSGRSAEEVAKQVGISTRAVYLAKARVLRRLRQELEGLLD